jgi:flagellar motor switch protein FliG
VDERGVTLSGRRKAAILCISLGEHGAAEVFKHLPHDVVEQLAMEMARTPAVESSQANTVLEEMVRTAYERGFLAEGGMRFARDVLERALGTQRAADVLNRLASVIESNPFEFLRGSPPEQIYAFLRNEHPQTIALVLAHLPTNDLAARVLQLLPPDEQADVATRVALMGQTSPDIVREVAGMMSKRVETVLQHEYSETGGIRSLAQILNSTERGIEKHILEHLAEESRELADEVRALLFVFEDLLTLDDRSIQLVLRDVDQKDLALALRGTTEEVKEKILANMSSRAAEVLREEMELMPPQRRRFVEEAQARIVAIVRKLEDADEIVLSRPGEDDEVL